MYYPWVQQTGAEDSQAFVPPSGAVAGTWVRSDTERGVWKAAANITLNGVTALHDQVTDDHQKQLTTTGINALRTFPNKGTVVWGARTLATDDNTWRHIPVRRLLNAADKDIAQAMQSLVFEPNSQPTWDKARAAVESYLSNLWQQGALQGDKGEDAYFVQIGKGVTMTDDDVRSGKLILKTGLAAVRRTEFNPLQYTVTVGQS